MVGKGNGVRGTDQWLMDMLRSRRFRFAVYGVCAVILIVVSALASTPEFILFRQRMMFSITDLEARTTLLPFDVETADNLTLRSWYIAPKSGRPAIVYFAGREGDLIRKPAHLHELAEAGYGLLLNGYRGYGGNPGRPSEDDMFSDAEALLDQAAEAGLAPDGFVIYGYSMGSGIAAETAARRPPVGLILEAPLSSFGDAVRVHANRAPRWMIRTRFDNIGRISQVDSPILLLAGGRDRITPASFAAALAEQSGHNAVLEVFADASHVSIIRLGGRKAVIDFLARIHDVPGFIEDLSGTVVSKD